MWITAGRKQFLRFMVKDFRVCSLKFDLQGIRSKENFVHPSIKQQRQVKALVWNPYLGKMRWIQPRNSFHMLYNYAIGYDKNRKVSNVNPNWSTYYSQRGVSLKGYIYFLAGEKIRIRGNNIEDILSFELTTERFGKRLPLPFKSHEIWVTKNKIDPCEVSWSKFLRTTFRCMDGNQAGSFFIDEEKKIVVVVDLESYKGGIVRNQKTNVIGQDGYFKSVNMGKPN
ncbi:hypothetical protein DY000_02043174 [Brassica cretica]|uniref:F-box associated beta-propeller type 1 domain-containing protein n=1 Tax=Brassica cretica TaxID=69181 RepID=A0ABQ7BBK5_BRACR|nr:hypothetical protein DY000_02043174 [Brassica cretica]